MRASRTSGSVEGVLRDGHPYSVSLNGPPTNPVGFTPVRATDLGVPLPYGDGPASQS